MCVFFMDDELENVVKEVAFYGKFYFARSDYEVVGRVGVEVLVLGVVVVFVIFLYY